MSSGRALASQANAREREMLATQHFPQSMGGASRAQCDVPNVRSCDPWAAMTMVGAKDCTGGIGQYKPASGQELPPTQKAFSESERQGLLASMFGMDKEEGDPDRGSCLECGWLACCAAKGADRRNAGVVCMVVALTLILLGIYGMLFSSSHYHTRYSSPANLWLASGVLLMLFASLAYVFGLNRDSGMAFQKKFLGETLAGKQRSLVVFALSIVFMAGSLMVLLGVSLRTGGPVLKAVQSLPKMPDFAPEGTPFAVVSNRPSAIGGPRPSAPVPDEAVQPKDLKEPGSYDLRIKKGDYLLGCAAPVGLFAGQPKYGCSGDFNTAETCDKAKYPIKDTKYVAAVHAGCDTANGRGTYGYAYDDGVGLKQCPPNTRYEWVLCPDGYEEGIAWEATTTALKGTRRFRVTNKCEQPIWVQQAGTEADFVPGEPTNVKLESGSSHTYAIPDAGLSSTRFLPNTGCDDEGNNCDVQSMPPCPPQGCDLPVNTKFEATWGCKFSGDDAKKAECALTGQGHPLTYQDWWDGSAVDGFTLPFSVLVDDDNRGLVPDQATGSSDQCGPVVCDQLKAETLCPQDEFLTPEA